jgi:transcriptional regulator with XRE-family HTH domain
MIEQIVIGGINLFDKELFSILLRKARGKMRQYEFANACGLSKATLSAYVNKHEDTPPRPNTLEKIAAVALGSVSRTELFNACGYIDRVNDREIIPNNIKIIRNNASFKELHQRIINFYQNKDLDSLLTPDILRDIENGVINPSVSMIGIIAKFAHVDVEFFYKENTTDDYIKAQKAYNDNSKYQADYITMKKLSDIGLLEPISLILNDDNKIKKLKLFLSEFMN